MDTIPNGTYKVKSIRRSAPDKYFITLANDLVLCAEPASDFYRESKGLEIKVKIANGSKHPLTVVIFRVKFPCVSYRTVLTRGDYVEVLI